MVLSYEIDLKNLNENISSIHLKKLSFISNRLIYWVPKFHFLQNIFIEYQVYMRERERERLILRQASIPNGNVKIMEKRDLIDSEM